MCTCRSWADGLACQCESTCHSQRAQPWAHHTRAGPQRLRRAASHVPVSDLCGNLLSLWVSRSAVRLHWCLADCSTVLTMTWDINAPHSNPIKFELLGGGFKARL